MHLKVILIFSEKIFILRYKGMKLMILKPTGRPFPFSRKSLRHSKSLSVKYNVKIIATNDVHFINAEDAEAHDRLICINTAKDIDDPNRLRYSKQEYLKSEEEMRKIFSDIPEAIDNVAGLVAKIEKYKLDHDPIMPEFELPEGYTDKDEYLRFLTYKGAKERWGNLTEEQTERIDFELRDDSENGIPRIFSYCSGFPSGLPGKWVFLSDREEDQLQVQLWLSA